MGATFALPFDACLGRNSVRAYVPIIRRDPCAYCAAPPRPVSTVDHITPRAVDKNAHRWWNLAGACEQCNNRKGARPVLLFLVTRLKEAA